MAVTHGPDTLGRLGDATTLKSPKRVSFIPGHASLAVLCSSGSLQLVPLAGGKPKSVLVGTPLTTLRTHLAVSPTGDRILAGRFAVDPAGKKLWTASTKEYWCSVFTMVVSPDGNTAFAACFRISTAKGKQTGFLVDTSSLHTGTIVSSAISRDGKVLATGDDSGGVVLTDVTKERKVAGAGVPHVGSVLADGTDYETSATQGFFRSVDALAFGKKWLAVGGLSTALRLLSARDLSLVSSLPLTDQKIPARAKNGSAELTPWAVGKPCPDTRGLAFAPDGVTLVSATYVPRDAKGGETRLQVWNAETGEETMRVAIPDKLGRPTSVAVSEDGATITLGLQSGVYMCAMPPG